MFHSIGIPHGFCYLWDPGLLTLHVGSDLLIALAYYLIPFALFRIVSKRRDIPYNWMLLCFGAFIILCGTTHVMEVVTLWHPVYWLSGGLKAVTAVVSLITFVLLLRLTPAILAFPSRAALEAANRKLESVMESTSVGMYAVDKDWKISYMNGKARSILAMQGEVLGLPLSEAFPAQLQQTRERFEQVMKTGRTSEFESYYAPVDLWARVTVNSWEGGGITVFFNDVSAEKRLEKQLEQERVLREQRILSLAQMAGGLAHEISNPLGIIHARACDLLEQAEEGEPLAAATVEAACTSMVKTSDRAIRILRGLRMFAREGAQDPMAVTEVPSLIEQTVALVQPRYVSHGISLDIKVRADISRIVCREVQIGQVILNLLNNAFDAIDGAPGSERWVRLEAKNEDGKVIVEVIDGGPGVADEHKPHLMQPFFTTKPVGAGMGVGLSLSRAIARDHDGELILTEDEGHTCFRLTLPAAA
jgi:two-component system NtrC family sensor kinase